MPSNKNKHNKPLYLFLTVSALMLALSWILVDTITYNQQNTYVSEVEAQDTEEVTEEIEEVTEEIEEVTEEIEEVTEEIEEATEEIELNRVYADLDIETDTNKLTISDDGKYFSYRCYYDNDTINFISKVDNSSNYGLIDIYKEGSYEFVLFKYTE